MKSKLISKRPKTYAVIFETGDEFLKGMLQFCQETGMGASRFTAVGAFERVTLAHLDWETKQYIPVPVEERVEVLTLSGDIALYEGKPQINAHTVLGRRDGTTRGGHILKAIVRPTLEVILDEAPVHLRKRYNPEMGLAFIDISQDGDMLRKRISRTDCLDRTML